MKLTPRIVAERIAEVFDIKVINKRTLLINGKKETLRRLFRLFPNKMLAKGTLSDVLLMEQADKIDLFEEAGHILVSMKQKDKVEESRQFSLDLFETSSESMSEYACIQDVVTAREYIISKETTRIIDMSVEFWRNNLPPELKKYIRPTPALLEYNPLSLIPSEKDEYKPPGQSRGIPVLRVNMYQPPLWRFRDIDEPEYPEQFKNLIEHLVPDSTCRRYLLNWMRNLIMEPKNETCLVLNGTKGIGKNLLVQLLRAIVGPENYGKANRGFLTKEFNALLENKKLILIDEQAINTPEKLDVIKDYSNSEQNIEKKGMDANKVVMTFNSFVINNNREVDLKLEQDDRRFSVMDVTDMRYLDRYDEGELYDFLDAVEDEEAIANMGHYLINECDFSDEFPVNIPWTGPKFQKLVRVSLWEWQKFILNTILSREDEFYEFERLKLQYKQTRSSSKSSISYDLVRDFLQNYRHNGKKLGKLERQDGVVMLIPSQHFLPGKGSSVL